MGGGEEEDDGGTAGILSRQNRRHASQCMCETRRPVAVGPLILRLVTWGAQQHTVGGGGGGRGRRSKHGGHDTRAPRSMPPCCHSLT